MAAVCMHSLKRGSSLPYSKYYFLQFLKSLKHATLLLFVYTHNECACTIQCCLPSSRREIYSVEPLTLLISTSPIFSEIKPENVLIWGLYVLDESIY